MVAKVSAVSPDCEIAITTSVRTDYRISVAEFRGVFYFHRNVTETFYQQFSHQSGMPGTQATITKRRVSSSLF